VAVEQHWKKFIKAIKRENPNDNGGMENTLTKEE